MSDVTVCEGTIGRHLMSLSPFEEIESGGDTANMNWKAALRRYSLPGAVGIFSGGSLALGSIATGASGAWGPLCVTGGALLSAAAGFAALKVQGDTERIQKERERAAVLEAAMGPVAEYMGRLSVSPTEHQELLGSINDRLVETASELAHPRARSTFYALQDRSRLVRRASSGTNGHVPQTFASGDERSDFLLGVALGSRDRYIDDLAKDPDAYRISLSDGFRTARIMRARAGEITQGLLIVEAPDCGDLSEDDLSSLLVIAHLVGVSQVIRPRNGGGAGSIVPHPAPPSDSETSATGADDG
ncbi:hypothetical protein [Streptomyces sp. V1I1]|uniref:hypothetical protein n=1 Tax=Streptomyces sp. V1I1 TaxID=3042272 RepID=UPI002786DD1C|nr:hypothetical protein [Streptomyces sp. V1I1]MDQ0945795.1 hypothetical protein [Streptomyces sp. V1I1]